MSALVLTVIITGKVDSVHSAHMRISDMISKEHRSGDINVQLYAAEVLE